ncbi:MAG: hypothetical protein COS76_00245 [Candidatus Portnoybacteria bacterium CG06_land_8_20_14_3_00_39_12]|uniref:Uncharacterized protein n=3 Tax=Candidatus Portnoyibacteriota TaxID=1817913 RepID=A0A2M8KH40_9BACT|nr:MAG: hypothetical protein AUJ33_01030 [Parcubacteria group bacterium CG1_02_40_25]PIU75551.1 MAG: hypothetical protein COS76_00245 [Candidatus Portnoybacteria bacterium CG06_land_8_20_14_3_00_39_12]PIZ70831.1 MAG: hypothetical protein COY09_02030 [Candidatus Portnoybacteria bacterium CG_4_10_14_0_2_um_filter_39_11]PJE59229.1 MAG: hypothetical protein COU83_00060 [Candidatus Portnoybacteria bacterium CG10_big_fil_rev_8_21_14_0_10_40_22]
MDAINTDDLMEELNTIKSHCATIVHQTGQKIQTAFKEPGEKDPTLDQVKRFLALQDTQKAIIAAQESLKQALSIDQ